MQQSRPDRTRGSSNAGISFHLTQFIAINARFVAALTGNRDRWPHSIADERTGTTSMIQKLQDSRAVLLGAVAIFAVGLTASGYVLGDGLQPRQDGRADGYRPRRFRARRDRRSRDLDRVLLRRGHDAGAGPGIGRPEEPRRPRRSSSALASSPTRSATPRSVPARASTATAGKTASDGQPLDPAAQPRRDAGREPPMRGNPSSSAKASRSTGSQRDFVFTRSTI